MPAVELADPSATSGNVLAQSSDPAHGPKPKTPMIAGSVVGGIMAIAYIIGFTIYFVKRCKRKQLNRRIAAGEAEPKDQPPPKERILIPPDPAVLLGHNRPGDVIVVDEKRHHHRQKSVPRAQANDSASHLVRADTDRISEEITVPADV
ncbi:hypothetical protein B0H17DRAFT_1074521 [Mycena rosella]|uniref:Uncharacterized protein n=1 Tax=Mycena rosella TaxID=1033263 RepID=A0AAD7DB19_MYCRO|nr:hypothetical protein B0H17DRAFT_1074521 [Mycena rosella]